MVRLTTMKWECLDCGDLVAKKDKRGHELKYDHSLRDKGTVIHPAPMLEVIEPELPNILPKAEVFGNIFGEFTGDARQDYPKTYEVFDAIRGLMYVNTIQK